MLLLLLFLGLNCLLTLKDLYLRIYQAADFFVKKIAHIEIKYNNDIFAQCFPILPYCFYINEIQKNDI